MPQDAYLYSHRAMKAGGLLRLLFRSDDPAPALNGLVELYPEFSFQYEDGCLHLIVPDGAALTHSLSHYAHVIEERLSDGTLRTRKDRRPPPRVSVWERLRSPAL